MIALIATAIDPELIFVLGLRRASFTEEPWTLISSLFVHDGFWHLAVNMFTLYFLGSFLLELVGDTRFWLVYFAGGIVGGLFFLWLAPPFATAVGSSGAIFSVGGALAVMRPRVPVMVFPIPVPIPLVAAIVGGFLILSLFPGIAWQAHLGGLLFGALAGFIFRRQGPYWTR